MFTGIVQEIGTVREVHTGALVVECKRVLRNTKLGDSIAVNGVCLTIVDIDEGSFTANVVPETYRRSNLGEVGPGDEVNLECAMLAGERLSGHIVQGHVDGLGTLEDIYEEGEDLILRYRGDPALMRYVVEKGSICIDGTSLTVAERSDEGFSVAIIPHTSEHTNLTKRATGDHVNLEVDVLAKYVEQLLRPYAERSPVGALSTAETEDR
ncbi:MAG TPA: riboflavin synthase [Dehalococcoidia bacterium]|nr:riboflavin synthase [Dehalococcoidia bacterium]